jgi:DNA-binding response OmpR family regulator
MKKILVVDDEEDLGNLIATALGKEGFEVIEADSGIDAYGWQEQRCPISLSAAS